MKHTAISDAREHGMLKHSRRNFMMTEPDWHQQRPDSPAVRAMWAALRCELRPHDYPAVGRLLDALRHTHANGGPVFARFALAPHPVLSWFLSRGRGNEIEFPERFLRSPPVSAALPDLCRDPVDGSFGFEPTDGFSLAGEIARSLSHGGAYRKHPAGPADAYATADAFRVWLYGDRFDEVEVLKSYKPWSAWFYEIAWDCTWLILDKRQSVVSVLALTDTD